MISDVIDRIRATLRTQRDRPGIEHGGAWMNWGDVAAYGEAIDTLLMASGCPPEGRIGIVIRNRAAHAAAIIGLLAHRRRISFLYAFAPKAVLAGQIADLNAAAIIADVEDWAQITEAAAAAGSAGIRFGPGGGPPSLVQGVEQIRMPGAKGRAGDDGAIEVLSSGTTGQPKRIAMPLRLLDRAVQSAPGAEAGAVPEVQINIWPLGGVGGTCLLAASAATGAPLVLIERFSVSELVSAIRRHRPSTLGLSPTAIAMLMDAEVPVEDLASVKSISGGSAHLDPDLQERFEKTYGVPIYWAMGATEFCGTIVRWTPHMREKVGNSKRGSVGLPMPGVELRVIDPQNGGLLEAGKEGLLEVLCPAVRPDWFRTTDLVTIDADGYVFHRGRYDGAIVRGGFKILPERLVEVLRAHPAISDASVVSIPDPRLGAVPVAAVELASNAPPVDEAMLLAFMRSRLPPMQVPTEIKIVDALPRTPSLKPSLVDVLHLFETAG
jgi:acyl-coenzyme A synthetase/AMP-(fatty) acid ligase